MSGSFVSSASDVFHALGLVAFEPTGETFRVVGGLDPSFTTSFPAVAESEIELAEVFPFLQVFIEEAESAWRRDRATSVTSSPWIQRDARGDEVELSAMAVRVDSRPLLLLQRDGVRADERRTLQLAREARLAHEQLERTTRALEESEKRYRELAADLEDRVRARTSDLRRLAAQLVDAEREERRRIATGLHDRLGQSLAVVKLGLRSLSSNGRPGDDLMSPLLASLDTAIGYTRDLTFDLGSPVLYELGLVPALEELCRRVAERSGFVVDVAVEDCVPISDTSAVLLYEAVRELLHNCEKHSRARRVTVRSRVSDDAEARSFVIMVEDDGCGFELASIGVSDFRAGFGLHSLRERVEYAGGTCSVDSAPSMGTRVELAVLAQTSPTLRSRSS